MTAHMPDEATLEELRNSPEGPVVLLNLIRLAAGSVDQPLATPSTIGL